MTSSKPPVRPLGGLEKAVLVHVGIFTVATTWALGGNAGYLRPALAAWGSLGAFIALAAILGDKRKTQVSLKPLKWLWPIALFNALILISCTAPLLRPIQMGNMSYMTSIPMSIWRPGAAEPVRSLRALWLFDAIYIACFNLAFIVRHRRALRALLTVAAANAFVLAVFGTVQKLFHATGLFFGLVQVPHAVFFASFIYRNHWGAYIVLMTAIILGLIRYHARHIKERDIFHSPVFAGIVILVVYALTIPLSGSRSCSFFIAVLLGAAFLGWIRRLIRNRRSYGESVGLPLTGAVAAVLLGAGAVWYLAGDVIASRVTTTEQQVGVMEQRGDIGGRNILYRDTWRMAEDKILFGWGMDSYPHVFWFYNTQLPNPKDNLPVYYHDAHSDWLQSLAEHGIAGTLLLILCAAVPLAGIHRPGLKKPIVLYLLFGCLLVLLYAVIELPFGNIAVVLWWWFCFFTAVRYTELERGKLENQRPASEAYEGPSAPPPMPA